MNGRIWNNEDGMMKEVAFNIPKEEPHGLIF